MKNTFLFLFAALLLPQITFAQTAQKLFENIPKFIDNSLIPFLFGMAFLVFVYNVVRYFIIGATNDKDRENAKNLAIYSVAAFVFLVIFWGIINMLNSSLGLNGESQPCSDYQKTFGTCP
jgi:succinate dehydrogenase/fumarate reductase cytochrome b subunit